DDHSFLQEDVGIADGFLVQADLLEGFLIHERVLIAVLVEKLILLLVELHALQHVGGADPLIQLRAVAELLELDLQIGTPVPHLDDMHLRRAPEFSVALDDIAGAEFVAVDFHGWSGNAFRAEKVARKLTTSLARGNRGLASQPMSAITRP